MSYLLTLKDNKKRFFFLQLMNQLDFIEDVREVKLSVEQVKLIRDFEDSIRCMKFAEQGKKKFKTVHQLLNEL